jgi:hypothetical protein
MGGLTLKANGKSYSLYLGMSVMARVQEKHGAAFDKLLSGEGGDVPNLSVIHDLFMGALQRYHAAEADEYLVDDLIRQNAGALGSLVAAASPPASESGSAEGKG